MINPNDPPGRFVVEQGTIPDPRWPDVAHYLLGEGAFLLPVGTLLAYGEPQPPEVESDQPEIEATSSEVVARVDFVRFAAGNTWLSSAQATLLFDSIARIAWRQAHESAPVNDYPRLLFRRLPDDWDQLDPFKRIEADDLELQGFLEFATELRTQLQSVSCLNRITTLTSTSTLL